MQEDWNITLSILESPDKSLIGRKMVFYRSPISIGRADNNDMVISEPAISRNHAILRITDDYSRVYVTDLSSQGTKVSGKVVPKGLGMGFAIENGDIIKLGDSVLQYILTLKPGVQSTFISKMERSMHDFSPSEMERESEENISEMETIDTAESPITGFSKVSIAIIVFCFILTVYLIYFTK
ncbi:MAG: FHA domain-containing protein [Candidatus Latescibacterota bacterium]